MNSPRAEVRDDIERRLARHAEALAASDVERALQLYTDEAVVRPANREPVRGKGELRQFFAGWFSAMKVREVAYTVEELDLCGDRAYHGGTYTAAYQVAGEEPVPDRGSFMIVWRRQPDRSWKYHRGIFNSSLPADQTITSEGG